MCRRFAVSARFTYETILQRGKFEHIRSRIIFLLCISHRTCILFVDAHKIAATWMKLTLPVAG